MNTILLVCSYITPTVRTELERARCPIHKELPGISEKVEFVHQQIIITVDPRRGEDGPQFRTVNGIVGIGTGMACYVVPDGTVLERKFPDIWLVGRNYTVLLGDDDIYGHCIPTNPLPANAETAKLLLSKLHEQQIHYQSDAQQIILAMATAGIGHWVWITPAHEMVIKK